MHRNRFNAPTNEIRINQNMFSTPPPNFNWQGGPEYPIPPIDYHVQNSPPVFPTIPDQQPFPHNQKNINSYCKSCNLWTTEPFESHKKSNAHKTKVAAESVSNQQYDSNMPSEQYVPKKPVNRNNNQAFEPITTSQLHMPRKGIIRVNNPPYEPTNNSTLQMPKKGIIRLPNQPHINSSTLHMPKTVTAHVVIPTTNAVPNHTVNDDTNDNFNNKKIKSKKMKTNINLQNPSSTNNNDIKNANPAEHWDKIDNIPKRKIDEISKGAKTSTPSTMSLSGNRGREVLLPVSGIYCILCEEFFQNTDKSETEHCKSTKHLSEYEKLLGQIKESPSSTVKRHHDDSKDDKLPAKRAKSANKITKHYRPRSRSPVIAEVDGKLDVATIGVGELSTRDSENLDLNISAEFQGPDVSLDFPDEIEDYDDSPI